MRNRKQLTTDNVYLGQRIKVGISTRWCQVSGSTLLTYLKGKIIEIHHSKNDGNVSSITFSAKWNKHHHYFKLDRMWTMPKDGKFPYIYICK